MSTVRRCCAFGHPVHGHNPFPWIFHCCQKSPSPRNCSFCGCDFHPVPSRISGSLRDYIWFSKWNIVRLKHRVDIMASWPLSGLYQSSICNQRLSELWCSALWDEKIRKVRYISIRLKKYKTRVPMICEMMQHVLQPVFLPSKIICSIWTWDVKRNQVLLSHHHSGGYTVAHCCCNMQFGCCHHSGCHIF